MLDLVRRILGSGEGDAGDAGAPPRDVSVAACAVFLEMAHIDGRFTEEERRSVVRQLREEFGLAEEDAAALAVAAREEREGSLDLWRFTDLINQNFTDEEKDRLIERIWRVVYADGRLDAHEDYLVHQLAHLLRLGHRRLIEAKLRVLRDRRSGAEPERERGES
ncbi:MAG: TerB family tellurite resistance protein [Candidatus Eisenbacteria bacterium]|nr:TerB family tellurite resistance protein [Candidatus Eisenbacteria bacterium]